MCIRDRSKEGLTLCTDGEYLWADGTTLGGDDGIAVAYILAILASDDIPPVSYTHLDVYKRQELTNELNYHNHKYYVDDAPEISDFAFDKMLVELEHLEEKYPEYKKKNSPTVRVGGEAVKSFGEVHHDVPMLSQQKAFSKEEILDFDRRVRAVVHDVNYVVEQLSLIHI